MKKNIIKLMIVISSIGFYCCQFSSDNIKKEHEDFSQNDSFEFSDKRLESIVDSLLLLSKHDSVKELYINKLDPHYAVLILFSGSKSAIGYENYIEQ